MNIIYIILVLLNIIFMLIGFLLSKIIFINNDIGQQQSFLSNQKKNIASDNTHQRSTISIDDTKVVVAIKTDGLEKKYQNLGNTQTSSENISNSVNKLKNIKR